MHQILRKQRSMSPGQLGYTTMLECNDLERAKNICGLDLQAEEDAAQPDLGRLNSGIAEARHQRSALHRILYDRPDPIDDQKMLSHRRKLNILLVITVLAALGCLTGNIATFVLLGIGLSVAILCGLGLTALAVVVGHLFYEWVVSRSWWLKFAIASAIAVLFFGGLFIFTQARSAMLDRLVSAPRVSSYVDGENDAKNAAVETPQSESSESAVRHAMGEGVLFMMLAADLALAFLVGLVIEMYSDDDFTSWNKLGKLTENVAEREERIARIRASFEANRKRCLAGILRAHSDLMRRKPPYHPALTLALIVTSLFGRSTRAQTTQHYEAILVDTSASISRGDRTNRLFHEYLFATNRLLLSEPPNSRVWVLAVSGDSFGETQEVLRGWTPEAHGVFTDDLDRARQELASAFEIKRHGMSPVAPRTDIFGALWRVKALFESDKFAGQSVSKEIWIFSDMMNDTNEFPMPKLVQFGSQQMLERAKAERLLIPLKGYMVHVYGASTARMSPREWVVVKEFWTNYFAAAGADLASYSAEPDCGVGL